MVDDVVTSGSNHKCSPYKAFKPGPQKFEVAHSSHCTNGMVVSFLYNKTYQNKKQHGPSFACHTQRRRRCRTHNLLESSLFPLIC